MSIKPWDYRQLLFARLTKNLSFYAPYLSDLDVSHRFICPACFLIFPHSVLHTHLSLAHVIPKQAGGGRIYTLVCSECDNRMGSNSDWHQAAEYNYSQFREKKGSLPGVIKDGDRQFNVSLGWGPEGQLEMRPFKGTMNNPKWKEFVEQTVGSPDGNERSVSGLLYNRKELRRSAIYSAYLMMFHSFGYEYVLSANADMIRGIIGRREDPSILDSAMANMPPSSFPDMPTTRLPMVGMVNEPRDKRCFIVILPSPYKEYVRRGILLPGFGKDGAECYESILKSDGRVGNMNIRLVMDRPVVRLDDPNMRGFAHYLWKNHSIREAS